MEPSPILNHPPDPHLIEDQNPCVESFHTPELNVSQLRSNQNLKSPVRMIEACPVKTRAKLQSQVRSRIDASPKDLILGGLSIKALKKRKKGVANSSKSIDVRARTSRRKMGKSPLASGNISGSDDLLKDSIIATENMRPEAVAPSIPYGSDNNSNPNIQSDSLRLVNDKKNSNEVVDNNLSNGMDIESNLAFDVGNLDKIHENSYGIGDKKKGSKRCVVDKTREETNFVFGNPSTQKSILGKPFFSMPSVQFSKNVVSRGGDFLPPASPAAIAGHLPV